MKQRIICLLAVICLAAANCGCQAKPQTQGGAKTTTTAVATTTTTQPEWFKQGFSCINVKTKTMDTVKKMVDSYRKEKKESGSLDFTATLIGLTQEASGFCVSEKVNAFLEHYAPYYEQRCDNLTLNDPGYEIDNFRVDYDKAFNKSLFLWSEYNLKYYAKIGGGNPQTGEDTLAEILDRPDFKTLSQAGTNLYLPVYYEDEFCGCIRTFKNEDGSLDNEMLSFDISKTDMIGDLVEFLDTKERVVQWCQQQGIENPKDVEIFLMPPDMPVEKKNDFSLLTPVAFGSLILVETDKETYVIPHEVYGLGEYTDQVMTKSEFAEVSHLFEEAYFSLPGNRITGNG